MHSRKIVQKKIKGISLELIAVNETILPFRMDVIASDMGNE